MTGALPSFFVIGAAKAGTTSLHAYLDLHPQVSMTRVKEPGFFAGEDFAEAAESYEELFDDPSAPARGESSAVYSQYPRWDGIPERIATLVAAARFVYLVRDPIDRAIAHYRQHVSDGKERRPLSEALADGERADSIYLCPSRYATQLRRYLQVFDRDRILVVDQLELQRNREATMARIYGFLGVEPNFRAAGFSSELNTAGDQRRPTALGRRVGGGAAVRKLPLPRPVRRSLRRLVSRPVRTGELDAGLRRRLEQALAGEAAELRKLSGLDLEHWSV